MNFFGRVEVICFGLVAFGFWLFKSFEGFPRRAGAVLMGFAAAGYLLARAANIARLFGLPIDGDDDPPRT